MKLTDTVTGIPNTPFSVLYHRFWTMSGQVSSGIASSPRNGVLPLIR